MENNKKLIVYYSYTGHTKMIAESIQKRLGCDILEIKPVTSPDEVDKWIESL